MPTTENSAKPLIADALSPFGYNNLPPEWLAKNPQKFSAHKTLYDYQQDALKNALVALWAYYGKEDNSRYRPGELQTAENLRRQQFAALLNQQAGAGLVAPCDICYDNKHNSFAVLAERLAPENGKIAFERLINRMGFWMATGSGKTLVMLKLVENLRRLMDGGQIPHRKILILAPGNLLLGQIQKAAHEYNRANPRPMDMINLRDWRTLAGRDAVFYHDATNVADERKKKRIDWRDFENNGEWYVLLDEAHRGQAEDSKRQAYYSLLARAGFLFNFSATFTDREDIMTTAAKFNLSDFTANAYGKHLRLCGAEFRAFANQRKGDYDDDEKQCIVLQSMMALALVKQNAAKLCADAEQHCIPPPYHKPLMVTLTNSVNVPESDLRAFFNVLAKLAQPGGLKKELFEQARKELADDLQQDGYLFETATIPAAFAEQIKALDENEVRRAVFLTDSPGGLEIITGEAGKELAIQHRAAAEPFGLIRIGETRKWEQYAANAQIAISKIVSDKSFFERLDESNISILMGSRAFVESWDSVRPNVINFVNIGVGNAAIKFIVQSIGRGVRIRPSPPPKERRRRISEAKSDLSDAERQVYLAGNDTNAAASAVESLFIFAAKRAAINKALQGLNAEAGERWENIGDIFTPNKRPIVGEKPMTLLAPNYKNKPASPNENWQPKHISEYDLCRISDYAAKLPDGMLAVAHNKSAGEIAAMRTTIGNDNCFVKSPGMPNQATTPIAAIALAFSHPHTYGVKTEAEMRLLRENNGDADIVHFRRVEVSLSGEQTAMMKSGLRADWSENAQEKLIAAIASGKLTAEAANKEMNALKALIKINHNFPELKVRNISEHYYAPLVAADDGEKAAYIRHIIKHESEAKFLAELEKAIPDCAKEWDGWMFSKLDEATDNIFIPYGKGAEYHKFYPDFVFWMCRGNDYKVVFVDPKGTTHAAAYKRIDGYRMLFEKNNALRQFKHEKWNVTVGLWFYNKNTDELPEEYRRHWTANPADIFALPQTAA